MAGTEEAKEMLMNGTMEKLLLKDQLIRTIGRHKTFRGFQEV
jgi:hypothetical protein